MPLEVHFLTKHLPALLTHVGVVACLSPWRHVQASALAESSPLLWPRRRLPSGVANPVLDEVAALAEAFPTLTALIQPRVSLDRALPVQVRPGPLQHRWREALSGNVRHHSILSCAKGRPRTGAALGLMTPVICGALLVADVRSWNSFWIF